MPRSVSSGWVALAGVIGMETFLTQADSDSGGRAGGLR
ncbi:exported hypothetical protein [Cupriavidus taiwanensis]|nr:exported hypothetical protein [Cupriavidus taiwanensis]